MGCLPRLEIEQGGRAGAAVVDVEWRGRCGARGWVVAEAGVECSRPGEAPEVETEPVRSLDGAPVWRCSGIPAAQEFGSGAESTAALVGFEGGAADGILGSRAV